jgi:tRNA modification GTPase
MRAHSDSLLDTIVALATPAGRSALAIVRISGRETRRILLALAPKLSLALEVRRPQLAAFEDSAGELIDTGLATFFEGPASATGEDLSELSIHGSPLAIERLLQAAVSAGARPARPGEFTERAFRSGKIDLVKAEAVRDLIEAKTPAAARISARRLSGGLSQTLDHVRDELLAASAGLAAAIDFSEDTGERVGPAVPAALSRALGTLTRLSQTARTGRLLSHGCRVAILGRPNAGKSTLFNAVLGTSRAIVTETPGTTRDTLEAAIDIGGIPVTLIDTAGLRDGCDAIERMGVERARQEAQACDALLYVFDAVEGWSDEDDRAIKSLNGKPRVVIANKADAMPAAWVTTIPAAVTLSGLAPDAGESLRAILRESIAGDLRTEETSEVLGSIRQQDLVGRAQVAVAQTLRALEDGLSPEYAATHCHAALDALADLVGETTSEEVLARLFETFCIGK